MLAWTITFFILAIVAGFLGFTGVAIISVEIAKILFFLFLVLFLASIVFGAARRVDRKVDENL